MPQTPWCRDKPSPHLDYVVSKFLIHVTLSIQNDRRYTKHIPLRFEVFFKIVTGTDFDSWKRGDAITNLKYVTIDTQNNRYGLAPYSPLGGSNK